MRKNLYALFLMPFLVLAACSKDKPDASDTESSPAPTAQPSPAVDVGHPGHTLRPDNKPPRIVGAHGSCRDEESREQVSYGLSFDDRSDSQEGDQIVFRKYPTQWKLTENFSPENRDKNPNNLPYFIMTMEDEDTSADKMSLAYEISASDQFSNKVRQYTPAVRYQDIGKKQWLIIVSEEKVRGKEISGSMEKTEYTLYLKATDGEHETFKTATFYVENVFPKIEIVEDPRYMDASNYHSIEKHRSVFWGDKMNDYLKMLMDGQPLLDPVAFMKILIKSQDDVRIKISYVHKSMNYNLKLWHQEWKDDEHFLHEPILEKSRAMADVSNEVFEWNGSDIGLPHVVPLAGQKKSYKLVGGDGVNQSGLILLFSTQFDFKDFSPDKSYGEPLKANLAEYILTLEGYLRISIAPEGMPESFYHLENNWDEYERPVSLTSRFYSN